MNAGQLCTREVVFSVPGESVEEAAEVMRQYDVGDVVVVEQDNGVRRPIGIVTDRDIAVKVVAHGLDPATLDVDEIMIGEIETVGEQTSVEEVAHTMKVKGVRRTPVVDRDNSLVGILAFDDIVDYLAEQMSDLAGLVQRQQEGQKSALRESVSPDSEGSQ